MLAVPEFTAAEARTNAAFDAILWALARPGLPRTLPEAGEGVIIDALIDRECRVYSADPLLTPQILRTGAEIADLDQADHVFLARLTDLSPIKALRLGSDLYPDEGATVALRVALGEGQPVKVMGPGVDGAVEMRVGGLPEGFWALRAALMRYPMGFDLLLVDGATVVGVPRSATVEAL